MRKLLPVTLGLLVVGMFGLTSCSSVPVMPESVKAKVLQSLPPGNKSFIYVGRPYFMSGKGTGLAEVRVDGNVVGTLANATFCVTEVDPGKHELEVGFPRPDRIQVAPWSSFDKISTIKIDCSPGRVYYYSVELANFRKDMGFDMTLLSEEAGKKLLKDTDMVKDSKISLQ